MPGVSETKSVYRSWALEREGLNADVDLVQSFDAIPAKDGSKATATLEGVLNGIGRAVQMALTPARGRLLAPLCCAAHLLHRPAVVDGERLRMAPTPELSTLKDINALIAQRIRAIADDEELQILEAGCGRKWPIDLSGTRYRLTGVDLDAKALETRKNEVRDLQEAIVGDLRSIDFPRAHFDVVYSAFVLEHIEGAEEVLEKLVLWLKPGGLLILQVPDRDSVYGFFARTTPFWFHVFYAKHFNAYYRRMGTAGQPGHGPYPTHHDPVIGRALFRRFAAEHALELEQEYGFRRLPRVQQIFSTAVSLLTLRRLASSHIDLCYIARRMPDAAAEVPAVRRPDKEPAVAAERRHRGPAVTAVTRGSA